MLVKASSLTALFVAAAVGVSAQIDYFEVDWFSTPTETLIINGTGFPPPSAPPPAVTLDCCAGPSTPLTVVFHNTNKIVAQLVVAALEHETCYIHVDAMTAEVAFGLFGTTKEATALGYHALFANPLAPGNVAVGRHALELHIDGINTAVGDDALGSNIEGSKNTALGYGALRQSAAANANTGVGHLALNESRFGGANTAVGAYAQTNNIGGRENVAIGFSALAGNDHGVLNTAVGFKALSASTASENTAVGSDALGANQRGGQNTGVGRAALGANINGGGNTAVGTLALAASTTSIDNTAVGADALVALKSGNTNTAIGRRAFAELTDGRNNVALGYQAGDDLTSGSHNIYIKNQGEPTESRTTRIGNLQERVFVAGIAKTVVSGKNVIVTPDGQLGVGVSSERFKENVEALDGVIDPLMELRPVTYRYKKGVPGQSGGSHYGLLAEEVAQVLPDLVVYDSDGRVESVRYAELTAVLLRALQVQQTQVVAQREALARLSARVQGAPADGAGN